MRRIRETLRLHLQAGLSYNEVCGALKISKSVVGKYVLLARVAGVDWELAQTLSDEELEARLFRAAVPRSSHHLAPDFALVHQELKRAGVTLMLLWEEYATGNPLAYKYTSFCIKYRAFAQSQQRSMRQIHIAGEKLFVDYAGGTVAIVEAATGEITQAQIFVATLGASNYTFACATARQTTADWIGAQVLALEFIGGVPRLIVPDQTRALIKTPDRYDPEPNRCYEEFARHYGCASGACEPRAPSEAASLPASSTGGATPPTRASACARRVESPKGRQLYSQRIATVEPVFANIRHHKRMGRFTLRGKAKVSTQWNLYCLVHNIEKMARYG